MPVYNEIDTIEQAIISACEANPLEIYVFDDHSTDGTFEVIQELQKKYSNLFVVRYPQKSKDHQQEYIKYCDKFKGKHIIGMGGDDILMPNIVNNCKKYIDAPIIFHNYHEINSNDEIILSRNINIEYSGYLTPKQVCEKFQKYFIKECGVASAIRHDCLKWLIELNYWELGAWSDSIGFGAVAAKYGAVYIPEYGSKFRVNFKNKTSYSQQSVSNSNIKSKISHKAKEFLHKAEIDIDTSNQLMIKWGLDIC